MPRDSAVSGPKTTTPVLSKSEYMHGLRCPLALYFNKKAAPAPQNDVSDDVQKMRDAGHNVGEFAKSYFPGGVEITAPYYEITQGAEETQKLMADGKAVIFEATAINPADGTHARIDVLRKVPDSDEYDLIEVKSGPTIKDHYITDLAFQYHVFTGAGFKIRKTLLMHTDGGYERGDTLDVKKFFTLDDVTDRVKQRQPQTAVNIQKIMTMLQDGKPPTDDNVQNCSYPRDCDYHNAELQKANIPAYSVLNLFNGKKGHEIAAQIGSYDIKDVPPEFLPNNKTKQIEIDAHKTGTPYADPQKLRSFIDTVKYPIYYLDYEGVSDAIPLYKGTKPFQQVPFQFSLHVQEKPGAALKHYSFLHKDKSDPREAFAKELVRLCGKKGSVIVYFKGYEGDRNEELARAFPQYADELRAINKRMVDLLDPFKYRWLYHPDQGGYASLKKVLPAFTTIDYSGLNINNGEMALNQYLAFVKGALPDSESKQLWKDLEEYCSLDTLAMVKLLDVVREKAGPAAPATAQKPLIPKP